MKLVEVETNRIVLDSETKDKLIALVNELNSLRNKFGQHHLALAAMVDQGDSIREEANQVGAALDAYGLSLVKEYGVDIDNVDKGKWVLSVEEGAFIQKQMQEPKPAHKRRRSKKTSTKNPVAKKNKTRRSRK